MNSAAEHLTSKKRFFSQQLYSLAGIVNMSLVALIIVVTILAYSTYSKLTAFEKSLDSMMDESLPSVIQSGKLYSQMNLLLSITEQLSMADSEAMRRIATNAIANQLEGLQKTSMAYQHTQYVISQISSVERELSALNRLVQQKIATNTQIEQQHKMLYQLQRQINLDMAAPLNSQVSKDWLLLFSRMLFMSSELITIDRLSQIRDKQAELNRSFETLSLLSDNLPANQQEAAQLAIAALSDTVLHPGHGLINQRQLQLKIQGRVQGRSNFVRNLIADYARLNEFESHQLNQSVLSRATQTSQEVEQQVRQASFLFVMVLLVYIGFAIFIQRVIVSRLKSLKNQVLQRSTGNANQISISGKDEIAELALSFERFAHTIELQKASLQEMSLRDALTGVANRRAFDDYYKQALNVATRQRWPLSILLIDVDFFKQYNDNYGHSQGDICLKKVANLIKSQLPRKTDVLARYGGEEFAVLLPDTDEQGAITVSNAILMCFKNAQLPHDFSGVADHVTVSVGISVGYIQQDYLALPSIEEADKALYKAKRTGRNRWYKYNAEEDMDE
ncbi:diguanylate cyclase [Alteromonas lipolytica]|uniref:diguanylate cyclase n=1 Tax=Alteromonas lipolytica TaxID=1856405 RepID=A0A1E8FCU4_9ALTE|nr:diguanylate cyclase [Alteromonas lipolytica]OFI33752.1 hypothetical protein BFC17_19440 [Alteromonas lipolytica]GGF68716.1 hypothetical protein GCM10011338_21170 [Alteromonas lipolytica]